MNYQTLRSNLSLSVIFFGSLLLGLGSAVAAEGGWMTNFEAAQAKAKAENKPLLINFTGSDWCPPCKFLHSNVFEDAEFKKFAEGNVILMEADFPRRKQQSAELKAQNEALAKTYGIEGFPTVIYLSVDGEVLDKTVGVQHADVESFIAHAKGVAL